MEKTKGRGRCTGASAASGKNKPVAILNGGIVYYHLRNDPWWRNFSDSERRNLYTITDNVFSDSERRNLHTNNSESPYEWQNSVNLKRRNCVPRTQNVLWMTEFRWFWIAEFVDQELRMSYEWQNLGDSERRNCIPRTQNVLWMRAAAKLNQWFCWGPILLFFSGTQKLEKNLGKMCFPSVNLAIFLSLFGFFGQILDIKKFRKITLFTSNTTTRIFFP